MTQRVPFILLLLAFAAGCAAHHERPVSPGTLDGSLDAGSSGQLDKLVSDVCGKTVVLLGEEPHHGGGRTLDVKAELVQRLMARCGFSAVYFESNAYEFADLNRRLAAGTSAPEQVADAIGGLWSVSSAIDPLVAALYTEASSGRIRLAGLDPQIGSATSSYEKAALPDDLVEGLEEPRRSTCATVISRRTKWLYDEEHPFDDAARGSFTECIREVGDAARPDSPFAVLAPATLAILTNPPTGPGWDARERQMANLFRWNKQRSPGAFRVIVWTANVHAARSSLSENSPVRPFGDELRAEYGQRLASIGFTALGGTYGRRDPKPIPAAGSESLEARALAGRANSLRYLSKAALVELGTIDGSLFDYDKPGRADWSSLFDGVIVLGDEKPLFADRPPKPRFVPPA